MKHVLPLLAALALGACAGQPATEDNAEAEAVALVDTQNECAYQCQLAHGGMIRQCGERPAAVTAGRTSGSSVCEDNAYDVLRGCYEAC